MELNHGGAVVREEYQEIRSVFNNRDHSGISAVIFDPLEELVWTGNQSVGLNRIDRKFGMVIMISVILFHVKNYVKTDEIELKCLGQGHISLHYTGCNMEILSPFSSDLYADLMVE